MNTQATADYYASEDRPSLSKEDKIRQLLLAIKAMEDKGDIDNGSLAELMSDTGMSSKEALDYIVNTFDYYSPHLKHSAKMYAELDDDDLELLLDSDGDWVEDDFNLDYDDEAYDLFNMYDDDDDLDDIELEEDNDTTGDDNHFDWEKGTVDNEKHTHLESDVDGDGNTDLEMVDIDNDGDIDIAKSKKGKGKKKADNIKNDMLDNLDSTGTVNKKDSDDWNTISETLSDYSF